MRSDSQAFWTAEDSFPVLRSVLSVELSLRQLPALFEEAKGRQALIITGDRGYIFKEFGRSQQEAPTVFGKGSLFNNVVNSSNPDLPPAGL